MIGFQHGRRPREAALNTDARMADSLLQDTHRLRYLTNVRFSNTVFYRASWGDSCIFHSSLGVASFEFELLLLNDVEI